MSVSGVPWQSSPPMVSMVCLPRQPLLISMEPPRPPWASHLHPHPLSLLLLCSKGQRSLPATGKDPLPRFPSAPAFSRLITAPVLPLPSSRRSPTIPAWQKNSRWVSHLTPAAPDLPQDKRLELNPWPWTLSRKRVSSDLHPVTMPQLRRHQPQL